MGKAVLVLDTPKDCYECKLQDWLTCRIAKKCNTSHSRPDWCPLRELPERKDGMNLNSIMEKCKDRDSIMDSVLKQFIVDGYNTCIDELLKGEEG